MEKSRAKNLSETSCRLCGLPTGSARGEEEAPQFCCPGCRQVFFVLAEVSGELPADFRNSDLFRACMDAGVIPGKKSAPGPASEAMVTNTGQNFPALHLRLDGMWCPACAWVVEEVLKKTSGVTEARVSFFSDTARVRYLPQEVSPREIISRISKIGYKAYSGEDSVRGGMKQDLLIRLGISSILTMNIMMLSYALYWGLVSELTPTIVAYFSYPVLAMTLFVIFYGGLPILRKSVFGLRHGSISMDTMISVSALAAFLYSFIRMLEGSTYLYFDTAAMLITIVLFGRYLELKSHERVSAALAFDEVGLAKARLTEGTQERWVAAAALKPGDHFTVRENERVPLDGLIVEGKALLDQSILTGEPLCVLREKNEGVLAGSLVVDGDLQIRTTKTSRESVLRRMGDLISEALEQKNRGEELSDKVSRFFVPAIFCAAGVAGFVMAVSGAAADAILLRSLTILLISCPCTLGIAIPLVKTVSIGLGKRVGLIVVKPEALVQVKGLDTIVFDKTGTLTEGNFMLRRIVCGPMEESEILPVIAAVESKSTHFLAGEIRRYFHSLNEPIEEFPVTDSDELAGMGVVGRVGNRSVFAGNRVLLGRCNVELPPFFEEEASRREAEGMTVVFFGWDGVVQGFLIFGDPLKEDARETIDWLKGRGIGVLLVSGDSEKTTGAIASSLGIADAIGGTLPVEKAQMIRNLQSQGRKVAMVGDGVNDAGALAQADVGFTLGSGYAIMEGAADLFIPSGKLRILRNAFALSAQSERTVRQNLLFTFLYNMIAIPVAAAGFLNPLIAVFTMFASSLTVIGNSLRFGKKLSVSAGVIEGPSPARRRL
jgi:heavy metal translocating P-type ATPase